MKVSIKQLSDCMILKCLITCCFTLHKGNVDITCLKELWSEALCFKNCATEFAFIPESEYELPSYMIDLDTFVRMNFRLEVYPCIVVVSG